MSCSLRQQQPTAYDDAAASTSYIQGSDCELIRALAGCSEDEAGRRAWKAAITNTLYIVGSDAGRAGGVAGPGSIDGKLSQLAEKGGVHSEALSMLSEVSTPEEAIAAIKSDKAFADQVKTLAMTYVKHAVQAVDIPPLAREKEWGT
eukprot:COSAG02_NODE_27880_length_601_cov_0.611554_1_plen_146_part_01